MGEGICKHQRGQIHIYQEGISFQVKCQFDQGFPFLVASMFCTSEALVEVCIEESFGAPCFI